MTPPHSSPYRFAVVAVVSGSFSIWEAGLEFVYGVVVGVAIGIGVGWLIRHVRYADSTTHRSRSRSPC